MFHSDSCRTFKVFLMSCSLQKKKKNHSLITKGYKVTYIVCIQHNNSLFPTIFNNYIKLLLYILLPLNLRPLYCFFLHHPVVENWGKKNENGLDFGFENTTCRRVKPIILKLQTTGHLSLGVLDGYLLLYIRRKPAGLSIKRLGLKISVDYTHETIGSVLLHFFVFIFLFYARTKFSFPRKKKKNQPGYPNPVLTAFFPSNQIVREEHDGILSRFDEA